MSELDIGIVSTDAEDNNQVTNNNQAVNNNQNTNNDITIDPLIDRIFNDDREADLFGNEEFTNAVYHGK